MTITKPSLDGWILLETSVRSGNALAVGIG